MNKELYEALKVIGLTCIKSECCGKCPLYYDDPNPFNDKMCVFRKSSPGGIFDHIEESYRFNFEKGDKNEKE